MPKVGPRLRTFLALAGFWLSSAVPVVAQSQRGHLHLEVRDPIESGLTAHGEILSQGNVAPVTTKVQVNDEKVSALLFEAGFWVLFVRERRGSAVPKSKRKLWAFAPQGFGVPEMKSLHSGLCEATFAPHSGLPVA
jgi:hypothetical protein